MIFASSLGAVVHMVGLLCIQVPYLIYILIIRPLDGCQHNIVECINEIFFTLSAMFLVFYNTETAWSRGLEVTFINYLLANSIIIALISLTGLIICLVRWAIKKLRSPKSNRIAATPIQTTESLSPEPELQPQQILTTPTNRVSSTLVSRPKPAEKNNSNEEDSHDNSKIYEGIEGLNLKEEFEDNQLFLEDFQFELENSPDKADSNGANKENFSAKPLDPYIDENNFLLEIKDTQECTTSRNLDLKNREIVHPVPLPAHSNEAVSSCQDNKRWGKENDKVLFWTLREMEAQDEFSISEFLSQNSTSFNYSSVALEDLCKRVGWISKPKKLLTRIKTFWDKDFSCREIKALKKILRYEFHYENTLFKFLNTY